MRKLLILLRIKIYKGQKHVKMIKLLFYSVATSEICHSYLVKCEPILHKKKLDNRLLQNCFFQKNNSERSQNRSLTASKNISPPLPQPYLCKPFHKKEEKGQTPLQLQSFDGVYLVAKHKGKAEKKLLRRTYEHTCGRNSAEKPFIMLMFPFIKSSNVA